MLDIKKDYIDFGEQLQPPPGFQIDYAVATSYTLDLYALLSIPLAIFYKQELDSEVSEENFQVLEAIQNLKNHLKIYCHKGKIKVPKSSSATLLAFIEDCVQEYTPVNEHQSFHPKIWCLRFKSLESKDVLYRLIVMSRNLTFDKSYDIAYTMDGILTKKVNEKNNDLVELLKKLNQISSIENTRFIKDLQKVEFSLCNSFDNYSFSAFPNKQAHQTISANTLAKKRLVISPFLSDRMIKLLKENTKKPLILFSRKIELDKLKETTISGLEVYYFSQEIANHHLYENIDEGGETDYFNDVWDNNLHAKLYIRDDENETHWDLGSANCSDAAFTHNFEFMIHLKSNLSELRVNRIKEGLLSENNGVKIFKPYERVPEPVDTISEQDFRKIEFELFEFLENNSRFSAYVKYNKKNRKYDFHLKVKLPEIFLNGEYELWCLPIGIDNDFQAINKSGNFVFSEIPLHRISCFIHWQIRINESEERLDIVSKADVQGIPEHRINNILRSIINNPEKFMFLLKSLLTDEPFAGIELNEKKIIGNNNRNQRINSASIEIPIYEELLLNLSRSPERLKRLSTLIENLSKHNEEGIIPDEFLKIWEKIKQFIPNE